MAGAKEQVRKTGLPLFPANLWEAPGLSLSKEAEKY